MEIYDEQWLQICGLLSMYREYAKKQNMIYEQVKRIAPELEDYFTDEGYEDTSYEDVLKKWKENPFIKLKVLDTNTKPIDTSNI